MVVIHFLASAQKEVVDRNAFLSGPKLYQKVHPSREKQCHMFVQKAISSTFFATHEASSYLLHSRLIQRFCWSTYIHAALFQTKMDSFLEKNTYLNGKFSKLSISQKNKNKKTQFPQENSIFFFKFFLYQKFCMEFFLDEMRFFCSPSYGKTKNLI